jgi:transcriptional regulator of arginine metabolism
MAKRSAISSNARRALVISYVNQGLVHSQNDLVDLLAEEGIDVTQATASRDLEDVGAVRGKDEKGEMRYLLIENSVEPLARAARVSDELILLASALDRASQSGEMKAVIGTIAGDDTVLVISRNATGGKALASDLRDFISPKKARRK